MFFKRLFFKCKTHTLVPIKIWVSSNRICMKAKCMTCYDEEMCVVSKEHPWYNYWLSILKSNEEYEDIFKTSKQLEKGTGISSFWTVGNAVRSVFNQHQWELRNEVKLLLLVAVIWLVASTF
ncbi:Uncharacterised protein [uncultured archaeon]|nr:Uncharacterised protein [uncultured archaeon]